jgi:probable F420-dependent oxidoreductase
MVQLGVIFPQTEIGPDPAAVRDFAQAVEGMGFAYLQPYDHVVGAYTERPDRAEGRWPYTWKSQFRETLVLLGYLAGLTQRIRLVPGIIVLPQRQTVLVAKQAAEVDLLSGGRLTLGVGIGWNAVEYEALGQDFHSRGRRLEEQIEVLRLLWTQERVDFHGRWDHIPDASINPLPVQRPIPIWIGGSSERAVRRIGRLADGFAVTRLNPDTPALVETVRTAAREAGRDPASLDVAGVLFLRNQGPEAWRAELQSWESLGATHLAINTMNAGLTSPTAHLEALRRVKAELEG